MKKLLRTLKARLEDITGYRMYKNGVTHGYDPFLDLEKVLGRDGVRTVFDIGANVGQSALIYAKEFPQAQIYCFEPVRATYEKLITNTKRERRIQAINCGMGRTEGKATINVNPVSVVSSIVRKRPEDREETILIDTIDHMIKLTQRQRIDFLKVDTEGFEMEVLAGAEKMLEADDVHFIQCECKPVEDENNFIRFEELSKFLGQFGYKLFGVYDQTLDCEGAHHLIYWNAIFICPKLIPTQAKWPR